MLFTTTSASDPIKIAIQSLYKDYSAEKESLKKTPVCRCKNSALVYLCENRVRNVRFSGLDGWAREDQLKAIRGTHHRRNRPHYWVVRDHIKMKLAKCMRGTKARTDFTRGTIVSVRTCAAT